MSIFALGFIGACATFLFFYTYMTPLKRVWFNDHIIGGWLDLSTWGLVALIATGTNGSLYFSSGLCMGFSSIFFIVHYFHIRFPSKTRLRVYGA